MKLNLYNTKTRQIEEFKPIEKNNIRIYSCGPTVYHYPHLGNLRAYIFADILNNTLHELYPESDITHQINITDVGHLVSDGDEGEDKMEKGSRRTGKSVWEIAAFYTEDFINDLNLLNIGSNEYIKSKIKDDEKYSELNYQKDKLESDKFIFTRATDFIKEQIEMIQKLEEKGYTYTTKDGVYFDTSKFPEYGVFAKLDVANMNAGERVDMGEKKNKTDFALWKFSPVNEQRQMEWESPWGKGFPGWHIECSAMSQKVLGEHFDIHTGGIDHINVHHTNEIAQSVCAHGNHEFVNYWCHVNFLSDTTGKMSKSNEDFLRLQTIINQGFNPSAYRYLLLTTNYRSELTFSEESLTSASNALNKLTKFLHEAAKINENIIDATKYRINESYFNNFLEKMCSDLNTSSALSIMWEMIGDKAPHTYSTILRINKILGLDLTYISKQLNVEDLEDENRAKVEDLILKRKIARESKDWANADSLREEIKSFGIEVVD